MKNKIKKIAKNIRKGIAIAIPAAGFLYICSLGARNEINIIEVCRR